MKQIVVFIVFCVLGIFLWGQLSSCTQREAVVKETPQILNWPSDGSLCCGDVVGCMSLDDGKANVEGLFVFDDFTVKLNSGVHNVKVTFLPSDTIKYKEVPGEIKVKVKVPEELAMK